MRKLTMFLLLVCMAITLLTTITSCNEPLTTTETEPTEVILTTSKLSSNNKLRSLSISPGTLIPTFSAGVMTYTTSVEYDITNVKISATAEDEKANLTLNSNAYTPGIINSLIVGINSFTVGVTAENGDERLYTILVTRQPEDIELIPAISVTTSSALSSGGAYNFGDANIKTSTSTTFTITNSGTAPLVLDTTNCLLLTTHDSFEITSFPENTILMPDATENFEITFTPATDTYETTNLSIISNDPTTPEFKISLLGTGTRPAASEIHITVDGETIQSGSTLDLSNRYLNIDKTIDFEIHNLGYSTLYFTSSPPVYLNDGWYYEIVMDSILSITSINPGESATFSLKVTALSGQDYSDIIYIESDDSDESMYTINISGTGIEDTSAISVKRDALTIESGTTHHLGNYLNHNAYTFTFEVENITPETLAIEGLPKAKLTGDDDFHLFLEPHSPLEPGEKTEFKVSFNPDSTGDKTATVSLLSDKDGLYQYSFDITATVIEPDIIVRDLTIDIPIDATFDFPYTAVDSYYDHVFTVANVGKTDLNLSNSEANRIVVTGDSSFSVLAIPTETLKPGQESQFIIRYAPTTEGVHAASVSIISDDLSDNPYTFDIGYYKKYFVNPSGSDTNPGSRLRPVKTIHKAIVLASEGDSVHVAAGSYEERVNISKGNSIYGGYNATDWSDRNNTDHTNVTYRTEISRKEYYSDVIEHDDSTIEPPTVTIDGFVIKNTQSSDQNYTLVSLRYGKAIISNNLFLNNDFDYKITSLKTYQCDEVTIINNTFGYANSGTDSYTAILNVGSSNVTIDSNFFDGGNAFNTTIAIDNDGCSPLISNNVIIGGSSASSSSTCIKEDYQSASTIINNTIVIGTGSNAITPETALGIDIGSTSTIIKNNIIYASSYGYAIYESASSVYPGALENNNFFNCTAIYYDADNTTGRTTLTDLHDFNLTSQNVSVVYSGNLDVNMNGMSEYFVGYYDNDYHLSDICPTTISEGGQNLSAYITKDYDGNDRTVSWSIGAFEKDL